MVFGMSLATFTALHVAISLVAIVTGFVVVIGMRSSKRLPGWKLINMFHGGKTPLLPVARLEQLGYHLVIIPSDTQRAAIKAMQRVLAAIGRDGSAAAMTADMATFKEREAVIGTADFIDRDKRYAS